MRTHFSMGDVEAFAAVARTLNFKAAADELHLSASALTRRIQRFEHAIGAQLLVRTTREVKLTVQGMSVYLRSQEMLMAAEDLLNATGKGDRHLPTVTVACTNSHAQALLPSAARQFARLRPDTPVRVIGVSATEVLDAVRRGDADLGISDMGLQEATLDFVPLLRERIVLAVPLSHRLMGRSEVRWADLRKERFISVWRGAPMRTLLDFELAKARVRISLFYEVRNQHTALNFVNAGLGVTAATEWLVASMAGKLSGIRLVEPEITCARALIKRRGRMLPPSAQAMWDVLLAMREAGPLA